MKNFLQLTLLFYATSVLGSVLQVPADYQVIQSALDATAPGDTVLVSPGTYIELLQTPSHSLTICSEDYLTGDSLFVDQTILDGAWQGPVITTGTTEGNRLIIAGLTIQRGAGDDDAAGAIQTSHRSSLTMSNVVFRLNRSTSMGSVFYTGLEYRLESVLINSCRLHLYYDTDLNSSFEFHFSVNETDLIRVEDFTIITADSQVNAVFLGGNIVHISRFQSDSLNSFRNGIVFSAVDTLRAEQIRVRNATTNYGIILALGTGNEDDDSNLLATDILVQSCSLLGSYYTLNRIMDIGGDHVLLNQVSLLDNFSNTPIMFEMRAGEVGTVNNLLVEGNTFGVEPPVPADCVGNCYGALFTTSRLNISDAIIQNNISNVFPFQEGSQLHAAGGGETFRSLLNLSVEYGPQVFRRMIFRNNIHIDHDDYDNPETGRGAQTGRVARISTWETLTWPAVVRMEDCLFVGNVETNPVPENPPSDPFAGNRQIGSTLSFVRSGGDNPVRQLRYEISNVHLLDNDDGGIDLIGADRASVRNLVIKDTHRMGAYIEVDTLEMTNVWIEGVDAWEANMNYPFSYWSPPFQVALGIHKIDQARIGNLTLVDNSTQFLFWTNDIDDPRLTVYNSILYGNECEFFTHPVHSIAEYPPPLLRYTLLDDDYTGEGNIYYEDPAFDPVLGSPWLSPQSPAVDAGHPGTEWQDLENPEIPGTAHWPSQGDLRADMGFTGGPHARHRYQLGRIAAPAATAESTGSLSTSICLPESVQLTDDHSLRTCISTICGAESIQLIRSIGGAIG